MPPSRTGLKKIASASPRSVPNSRVVDVARLVHLRLDVSEQVLGRLSRREAALVRDPRDFRGDVRRDLADARQRRIEAALREVRLR